MQIEKFTFRLGTVLNEAGLISIPQLEIALQEQSYYQEMRIGEILALHGWLKQETADFFADHWPYLCQAPQRNRLGYYLTAAGLLNEQQVQQILAEQNQTGMRLGALAVLQGWIKQPTLDFFLKNLAPEELNVSPFKRYVPPELRTQQAPAPRSTPQNLEDNWQELIWMPDPMLTVSPQRPAPPSEDEEVSWVG